MKRLSILCLGALMVSIQAWSYEPLTLQEVLNRSTSKAEAEDTGVAIARSRLQLLESMNQRRFQFRPQLGLLSFSNPMMLATSIGAGVSYGKPGAPTEFDIENARFDLLAAQVALEKTKVRAQIEASRRFFDLLEKQQLSASACRADEDAYKRRASVEKMIADRKLTELDQVRFEVAEQQVETVCVEAESQRKISAVMMGALLTSSGDSTILSAVDADQLNSVASLPMPTLENLVLLAMTSRNEPRLIRSEIAGLQKPLHGSSAFRPSSISIGYHNLKTTDAGALSRNQNFLQGHSIMPEATWDFSRRSLTEKDARKHILALRAKALEIELAGTEQEIRAELERTHVLTVTYREKLQLARKRLELSNRAESLVKTRFDHGFGSPELVFEAESDSLRAQAEVMRMQNEIKAGLVTLFALCGGRADSLPELTSTLQFPLAGGGK